MELLKSFVVSGIFVGLRKGGAYSEEPPMTATRPCWPVTVSQAGYEVVGNEPLWNLSSSGGTIRRTLPKRILEEVDTWTVSIVFRRGSNGVESKGIGDVG